VAPVRRERLTKHPDFAEAAWTALATAPADVAPRFDPATLHALPPPARRFLAAALPDGVVLSETIELEMDGAIKLGGRWLGFHARQILRPGAGFVWAPVVGGRILRFVGADVLHADEARMEFRLHGRIPVVRSAGPDIRRSAQGRLAAETVAWSPQALTPQAGARWVGIDDERAIVTIAAAGADVGVEVAVSDDGQLRTLGLQRWQDSAKPPTLAPFGGSVDSTFTADNGVRIAGRGTVGWDWHTPQQRDGVFFRYQITGARFPSHPQPPPIGGVDAMSEEATHGPR
jgi:hypothetical protein